MLDSFTLADRVAIVRASRALVEAGANVHRRSPRLPKNADIGTVPVAVRAAK